MPESQRRSGLVVPGLTVEVDPISIEEALRKNKPFNYGRDSSVRRIELGGIVLCAHDYLDRKTGSRDEGSFSDMTKIGLVDRYAEALNVLETVPLQVHQDAPLNGLVQPLQPRVIHHGQPFLADVGGKEGYIVCTPWIDTPSLNDTFPTHPLIVTAIALLNYSGLSSTFGSVRVVAKQLGIELASFESKDLDTIEPSKILRLLVKFLTHKDFAKLLLPASRDIAAMDIDSALIALRQYTSKPLIKDAPPKLVDALVADLTRTHQESLWWGRALTRINAEMNEILRTRTGKDDPVMRVVYENAKITQGPNGLFLDITDPIFSFREGFAPSLSPMGPRIRFQR